MYRRDSVVGSATRYALDGPGFEIQTAPRPTQPPAQLMPGLCPGGKAAGEWR